MAKTSKHHGTKHKKTMRKHSGGARGSTKDLISTFLHMLDTVKLYHWKTTSYATHKATDQLHADLSAKIDSFVEILLGKPENTPTTKRNEILKVQSLQFKQYKNNEDFKKQVEEYKKFLENLSIVKQPNNNDLANIRDDLLGTMNQFLYLLTLE
jgi:hypothetical protein